MAFFSTDLAPSVLRLKCHGRRSGWQQFHVGECHTFGPSRNIEYTSRQYFVESEYTHE
jgi:hypothetical protein